MGPQLVEPRVEVLSIFWCRGDGIKPDHRQKRGEHRAESDLFMDEASPMTGVSSNDKVPDPSIQRHVSVNFDLIDSLGNGFAEHRGALRAPFQGPKWISSWLMLQQR